MTHQDQWTELERLLEVTKTMRDYVHDAANALSLTPSQAYQVLRGNSADTAMAKTDLTAIDAAIAKAEAALADREQPGTDGSAATGSEPSPVSLSGEAVAWRYRHRGTDHHVWRYDEHDPANTWESTDGYEVQPLYTAPSSQGREGGE